jgi:hypothetical protein
MSLRERTRPGLGIIEPYLLGWKPQCHMEIVPYAIRAFHRLRSRGLADTASYSAHALMGAAATSYFDMRYGGKLCRTRDDSSVGDGYFVIDHTPYAALRAMFDRVRIERETPVDVGCGEGRVINFWLSRYPSNPIVGIEANQVAARSAARRGNAASRRLCPLRKWPPAAPYLQPLICDGVY